MRSKYAYNITDEAEGAMMTFVEIDDATQTVTLLQEGEDEGDPNDIVVLSIESLSKLQMVLLNSLNKEGELISNDKVIN
jgi:hypothetical protein